MDELDPQIVVAVQQAAMDARDPNLRNRLNAAAAIFAALARRDAREREAWAIVRDVAKDNGPLVSDRDYGAYDCGYCDGVPEQWKDGTYALTREAFIHAPDCLVTRARALLGGEK